MRKSFWKYILLFMAGQVVGSLAAIAFGLLEGMVVSAGADADGGDFHSIVFCVPLLAANIFIIALFVLFWPSDMPFDTFASGLRKPRLGTTLRYVAAGLGLIPFVNIMQELLFSDLPDFIGNQRLDLILSHPLGILAVCLLGPVAEELVFRAGMIKLPAISPSAPSPTSPSSPSPTSPLSHGRGVGAKASILLSSLIFALIHFNPAQMPAAFIIGLVLGAAYLHTRSLTAPLLIHIVNNTLAATLSMAIPPHDNGEAVTFTELLGSPATATIVALSGLLWTLIWLWPMLLRKRA